MPAEAAGESVSLGELIAAMEGMGLAVMVRNADDMLVLVNRAFTRLLGYRRGQVLGLRVQQLVRPDMAQTVSECGAAIRAGLERGFSGLLPMVAGDGRPLISHFHTTMLVCGGEKFLVTFLEDWSDINWAAPELMRDGPPIAPVPDA